MSKKIHILLFAILVGCALRDNVSSDLNTIKIQDEDIIDKYRLSEMVENIQFIKLEDDENSLISNIDKILPYGNKIFILQRFIDPKIMVFTTQGSYLYNIGEVGQGPGEFTFPYDINIDSINSEILVLGSRKIMYYDLKDGEFKRSVDIDLPAKRFQQLPDGNFAFLCGEYINELVITDDTFKVLKGYFPQTVRNQIDPLEPFHLVNNKVYFHMTMYDTIYSIEGNSLQISKAIDFEKKLTDKDIANLPRHISTNISELKKNISNYMSYMKVYTETLHHIYAMFLYQDNYHVFIHDKFSNNSRVYNAFDVVNNVTYENTAFYIFNNSGDREFIGMIMDINAVKENLLNLDPSELSQKEKIFYDKLNKKIQLTDFDIANPILFRVKFEEINEI